MANDNDATDAPSSPPEGSSDAAPTQVLVNPEDLQSYNVGAPFAFSGVGGNVNATLLEPDGDEVPPSLAYIECDCGQAMSIELLDGQYKKCPGCGARFSHALIIAAEDDDEVAPEMLKEIMRRNDLLDEDPDDEDDDDDDDDDDDPEATGIPPADT